MNKLADIHWDSVGRAGLGGAIAGGSAAAIIDLLHSIQLHRKLTKSLAAPSKTDENTIVINLPPKAAGVIKQAGGWPTLTATMLASGIGGAAGYALVQKLMHDRLIKKLQTSEDDARQDYINQLMAKRGSALDFFDEAAESAVGMRKQAAYASPHYRFLDVPMATWALMTILGTGASAYLTKRIIDEQLHARNEKDLREPKLRRIVFRTAPSPKPMPNEEPVTNNDVENVKAAVAVMADLLNPNEKLCEHPVVTAELKKIGTSQDELHKLAMDSSDDLMGYMGQHPELRRMIQGVFMDRHPFLKHFKWALNVPGISNLADNSLMSTARKFFHPGPGYAGSVYTYRPPQDQSKLAGEVGMIGDVVSGIVGDRVADKISDRLVMAPMLSARGDNEPTDMEVKRMVKRIRLNAADPAAKAFLQSHQGTIKKLLTQLAQEGNI